MEVCAPPDSKLGVEAEKLGGKVMRLGKHNMYDLTTNAGYRRASETLREEMPRRVVFSPPCTARSIIQNASQNTPEQREKLEAKRRKNDKVTKACVLLAHQTLHQGVEIDFEQPLRCGTWSLPFLRKLREQLFTVR
eukprot:2361220-Pyramimonas_sp.AAC.1